MNSRYQSTLDLDLKALIRFVLEGGYTEPGAPDYTLAHLAEEFQVEKCRRTPSQNGKKGEVLISANQSASGIALRQSYQRYRTIAECYLPDIYLSHLAEDDDPTKVTLFFRLNHDAKSPSHQTIYFAGINKNWRISELVADCLEHRGNLVELIRKRNP